MDIYNRKILGSKFEEVYEWKYSYGQSLPLNLTGWQVSVYSSIGVDSTAAMLHWIFFALVTEYKGGWIIISVLW